MQLEQDAQQFHSDACRIRIAGLVDPQRVERHTERVARRGELRERREDKKKDAEAVDEPQTKKVRFEEAPSEGVQERVRPREPRFN